MNPSFVRATIVAALLALSASASLAGAPGFGPELQGFDYPWAVHDFAFQSQGEPVVMRYMDVRPEKPNGQTAIVLHGKNFCAATWEETIRALSRRRLSGDRARPDRLVQIDQARAPSIFLS